MKRILILLLINAAFVQHADAFMEQQRQNSNILFLELDEAVALGLQNSYDLKFKRIDQLAAKKMVAENFRSFLPVLSVNYGNSARTIPYGPDTRFNSIKLNMEQPIFRGGKYYASWKAAKADISLQNSEQHVLNNNITTAIRKNYFELIILNEVCSIQDLLCQHARAEQEIARVERDVGTMTVIDLAEIETYTANSELDKIRARNELDRARSEFKKLLYLDSELEIMIDKEIADEFDCMEPKLDERSLTGSALVEREEIQTRQFELMKANMAYQADKYYYLPDLSMNFEYDLQGEHLFPFERSWNAGIKCQINFGGTSLSTSGNTGGEMTSGASSGSISSSLSPFADISVYRTVIQAEARSLSARIENEKLKRDIALEVSANTRKVNEDWEMLKILRSREEVLKKRFNIYQIKMKVGDAKRTDTLKAEVEYAKAKVETVKGTLEYIIASLDLETSAGRPAGSLGTIIQKEKK